MFPFKSLESPFKSLETMFKENVLQMCISVIYKKVLKNHILCQNGCVGNGSKMSF